MKPNIHPKYEEMTIIMPDGTELKTRSTKGGRYLVDVDYRQHQAWSKSITQVRAGDKRVAEFNRKFGNISFGGAKPQAEEVNKESTGIKISGAVKSTAKKPKK